MMEKKKKGFFEKNFKIIIILGITIAVHLVILFITIPSLSGRQKRKDNTIFKIVDIKEYQPEEKKDDKIEIAKQEKVVEDVIETDKEVKELDIDYLPQHKISKMPVLPIEIIRSKKVYPPLANKQGIEAIVILELYIDQNGNIRNIKVLKDPGYGFAEAAVKALSGVKCIPAMANGIPVAARIRYPVSFKLK